MKSIHISAACVLLASSLAHAQPVLDTEWSWEPSNVTATRAPFDLWTKSLAVVRMVFAPNTLHESWPGYAYNLDAVRAAGVCNPIHLARKDDFWLGEISVVKSSNSAGGYEGFAVHAASEGGPSQPASRGEVRDDTDRWNSELALRDLCAWFRTIDSDHDSQPDTSAAEWLLVTNRVIPDITLNFTERLEVRPDPGRGQLSIDDARALLADGN